MTIHEPKPSPVNQLGLFMDEPVQLVGPEQQTPRDCEAERKGEEK